MILSPEVQNLEINLNISFNQTCSAALGNI
jgi:hypothetical protein